LREHDVVSEVANNATCLEIDGFISLRPPICLALCEIRNASSAGISSALRGWAPRCPARRACGFFIQAKITQQSGANDFVKVGPMYFVALGVHDVATLAGYLP